MSAGEGRKGRITPISHALYILSLAIIMLFAAVLQCSGFAIFGAVPDLCFALVCAIGFILGDKYGAIFGLVGGIFIWALGSGGISLAMILYALCGYICGALPQMILRRNFLSYLVYTAMMGGIHLLFTFVYFIMLSTSYEIWQAYARLIIPEFILCVIFMTASYGPVKLIYILFKEKKKDSKV